MMEIFFVNWCLKFFTEKKKEYVSLKEGNRATQNSILQNNLSTSHHFQINYPIDRCYRMMRGNFYQRLPFIIITKNKRTSHLFHAKFSLFPQHIFIN